MTHDNRITAIVHTYNAREHLGRVLDTLRGFDELLVVDMESTDDTCDIARQKGARVVTFPRGEHRIVEPARQFGIDHASHGWVLEVDADELVPPELTAFLRRMAGSADAPDGLYIPRRNYFMGREMHSGYPDPVLRFFRRDKCRWPATIHAIPQIDGRTDAIPARARSWRSSTWLTNRCTHAPTSTCAIQPTRPTARPAVGAIRAPTCCGAPHSYFCANISSRGDGATACQGWSCRCRVPATRL